MTAYDAAFQEYVRGRASLADVWAADPYDDALREMARRYYQGETGQRGEPVKSFWSKVTIEGVVVGGVAALLLGGIASALGRF